MKKFFFTVAVFTVATVSTFAARTGANMPPMVEPSVAGVVMPPVAGPGKTATPPMGALGLTSDVWWIWI